MTNPRVEALKRLQQMIEDVGKEREAEHTKSRQALEEERRDIISGIGNNITEVLRPIMDAMAKQSRISKDDLREALAELKMPEIPASRVTIPPISVPAIKIPEIKIPEIKAPQVHFSMPNDIEVSLKGVNNKEPLPVILMDGKGNPYIATSGGGGNSQKVLNVITQGGQDISDEANRAIRVNSIATSITGSLAASVVDSSGVQYSGSNPLPITFSTGTITGITNSVAVSVVDSTGIPFEGANAFPITGTVTGITNTVGVSVVDSGGVPFAGANAFPITGTVTGITNSIAVNVVDSTGVAFEGANGLPITGTITAVTNITNSVAASLVDSTGVQYSGSNPLPIVGPVVVTSITNSVASALVDSTGVAYSGSNPVPIVGPVVVTSITNTTAIVGNINSYVADDETPPVKVGGIARTTNPTKASDGNRVTHSFDAVGRALVRPVQVRGLIQTAYVSITTGTEATLLAGSASTFFDLVYVMATNSSDAAVTVDLRAATAAGIQTSIRVPANGTAGVALSVPIPQDAAGDTWTADLPDITGTTVTVGALFSKEV